MEDFQKSYYAVIPANVRYSKRLSANQKLLFGEITALSNERGYCFATNSYFANLYDVDKLTISRWISALEQENFLITFEHITSSGSQRRIKINTESTPKEKKPDNTSQIDEEGLIVRSIGIDKKIKGGIQKDQGGLTKRSRGVDEKINHNTKVNIKDNIKVNILSEEEFLNQSKKKLNSNSELLNTGEINLPDLGAQAITQPPPPPLDENTQKNTFESFRKKYPGTKGGLETSFMIFKKHKDWKDQINKLEPALEKYLEYVEYKNIKGEWIPEHKHLKTWLNNRCWEDEFYFPLKPKSLISDSVIFSLESLFPPELNFTVDLYQHPDKINIAEKKWELLTSFISMNYSGEIKEYYLKNVKKEGHIKTNKSIQNWIDKLEDQYISLQREKNNMKTVF